MLFAWDPWNSWRRFWDARGNCCRCVLSRLKDGLCLESANLGISWNITVSQKSAILAMLWEKFRIWRYYVVTVNKEIYLLCVCKVVNYICGSVLELYWNEWFLVSRGACCIFFGLWGLSCHHFNNFWNWPTNIFCS